MNIRIFSQLACAVLLVFVATAPHALAQNFSFSFSDGLINASGSFSETDGVATAGSVTVTGPAQDIGTFTLVPNPNPPSIAVVNVQGMGGNLDYDSLVTPSNPQQVLDDQGLAFGFDFLGTSSHGTPLYQSAVNIWGNGGGSYTLAEFDSTGIPEYNGTLDLISIPEPSSYAAVLGAAALAVAALRRKQIPA